MDPEFLKQEVCCGNIAIIPVGFRCFTSMEIEKRLGISQKSLPFDSGFFPPDSVASIIDGARVDLLSPCPALGHVVCTKKENHISDDNSLGISFESSSYDDINGAVDRIVKEGPKIDKLNPFLDHSFGYYTLDVQNNIVLAHYNWHALAAEKLSSLPADLDQRLAGISRMLNRRIDRMYDACSRAKRVVFIYGETQGYSYMEIDKAKYSLSKLDGIVLSAEKKFPGKSSVVTLSEVDTLEKFCEVVA